MPSLGELRRFQSTCSSMSRFNGETVVVLSPLISGKELDLEDVGPMFKTWFPSGRCVLDVFEDELRPFPAPDTPPRLHQRLGRGVSSAMSSGMDYITRWAAL